MNAKIWSDDGCARRGNPRETRKSGRPDRLRRLARIVQVENGAHRREGRC